VTAHATLRQLGGCRAFRSAESEYDTFGTAHSSTSISAALGMALAASARAKTAARGHHWRRRHDRRHGLRGAEQRRRDRCNLLVILNDNDMSISPPVGALNRYLAQLMSGQFYAAAKNVGKTVLRPVPPLLELAKRLDSRPRAWWCLPRCSKSSASTTSAPSTGTTWTR
jgi:1-deoxy-D-xylulose-5-phosphate synthase